MNECANGCADLAVGPRSGAEGFTRIAVADVATAGDSNYAHRRWYVIATAAAGIRKKCDFMVLTSKIPTEFDARAKKLRAG